MQTAAACTWSADGLSTPLARTLMDSDPGRGMGRLRASGYGLVSGLCLSGLLVGCGVWLVVIDTPTYRFVVRLFGDKLFLREVVETWGVLTPVLFIALQALQVIVSPIPGEATGLLGGHLFRRPLRVFFSTIRPAPRSL